MPEPIRGKVFNKALATQERDFSGLVYGKITPTDIDAFMDFGDLLFVYIEAKLPNVKLPYGQKLALERLAMRSFAGGVKAVVIVCEHQNRVGVIDFAMCKVTQVYWKSNTKWEWRAPSIAGLTVRGVVDKLLQHYRLNQYIEQDKAA